MNFGRGGIYETLRKRTQLLKGALKRHINRRALRIFVALAMLVSLFVAMIRPDDLVLSVLTVLLITLLLVSIGYRPGDHEPFLPALLGFATVICSAILVMDHPDRLLIRYFGLLVAIGTSCYLIFVAAWVIGSTMRALRVPTNHSRYVKGSEHPKNQAIAVFGIATASLGFGLLNYNFADLQPVLVSLLSAQEAPERVVAWMGGLQNMFDMQALALSELMCLVMVFCWYVNTVRLVVEIVRSSASDQAMTSGPIVSTALLVFFMVIAFSLNLLHRALDPSSSMGISLNL